MPRLALRLAVIRASKIHLSLPARITNIRKTPQLTKFMS